MRERDYRWTVEYKIKNTWYNVEYSWAIASTELCERDANRKFFRRDEKQTGPIDRRSRVKIPSKRASSSEKPAVP